MNFKNITPQNCIFFGFKYFLLRPYLWLGPLFYGLLSFLLLVATFFIVAYLTWPSIGIHWSHYLIETFKSIGYSSLAVIIFWVLIFPTLLNIAFENLIGKVLHDLQYSTQGHGLISAFITSLQVIFRTLGWRIFWPLLTLLSIFLYGPLTIFFAQLGIGHIAMIDALDLSLSIQGISGKKRIFEIKKRSFSILFSGVLVGLISMALTTTIIGWFFFLPSVYVGCTLCTLNWTKSDKFTNMS